MAGTFKREGIDGDPLGDRLSLRDMQSLEDTSIASV